MADLGKRVSDARKVRGFNQRELSEISGVSLSLIRKIEQGERNSVRLATLRKLAVALRVRTSTLQAGPDTEHADAGTADLWGPVRQALAGRNGGPGDEPVTAAGVSAAFDALYPRLAAHEYRDVAAQLPGLIADAEALDGPDGRALQSKVLGVTGWLLIQNRQFDTATMTLERAIDRAPDHRAAVAAVNGLVWSHLRQGQLAAARDLAVKWADEIEPRFSKATASQLALWGRLWLYVANVGVRDNSPGATDDALALARAAATRIGREVLYDSNPHRPFGPATVAQIAGECAIISDEPDRALAIAETVPEGSMSRTAAPRLRHRLDVAAAHTALRQWGEAIGVFQELRATAPEWLAQQRYARDVLGRIVSERRTLTAETRSLAELIRLEY